MNTAAWPSPRGFQTAETKRLCARVEAGTTVVSDGGQWRQMVELVRAGRDPADLAREFEPSSQAIRNWVAQADQQTGDLRLLVHIEPATPLDQCLHPRLPSSEGDRDAAGRVETLPHVFPVPGGDKE